MIKRAALWCFAAAAGAALGATALGEASASPTDEQPRVLATEIATEITPVVADQIGDGVSRAADGGYAAYVIELDTPGGLDTSMREIVQHILGSQVPVIVHVAPEGGRAASAGAVISLAAHATFMAPGTAIGAATPVAMDGELDEATQRKLIEDATAYAVSLAQLRDRDEEFAADMVTEGASISAAEAVDRGVVDGRAATLDEALSAADGMTVDIAGSPGTISTSGAGVDRYDMTFFRQVQQVLANPNIAFILLTIGTLGLIYELASPGVGIAGSVGAVSLVLALVSLAVLPVTVAGLLLLGVAVALFVAELFAPGVAGFAIGGAVAFVLAAIFLFDDAEGVSVDPLVAIPTALLLAILVIIAGRLVVRSQRSPTTASGPGLYTGHTVTAHDPDETGTGARAFIDGSWWRLRTTGAPLREGQQVEVVDVDGLTLIVSPEPADQLSRGKEE